MVGIAWQWAILTNEDFIGRSAELLLRGHEVSVSEVECTDLSKAVCKARPLRGISQRVVG
jgi:hypothetical protein